MNSRHGWGNGLLIGSALVALAFTALMILWGSTEGLTASRNAPTPPSKEPSPDKCFSLTLLPPVFRRESCDTYIETGPNLVFAPLIAHTDGPAPDPISSTPTAYANICSSYRYSYTHSVRRNLEARP